MSTMYQFKWVRKALRTIFYAFITAASVTGQAGDLQGMEISLDGSWNIANTAKKGERPVMVAMKIDDGQEGNSPMLVMTCEQARGVQVYINWSGGRILEDNRQVTYQIDDDEPVMGAWTLSSDGYATFYPGSGSSVAGDSGLELPVEFARKLAESKRLKASVIIGRETPRIARFRLQGTREALQQIRDGCGR